MDVEMVALTLKKVWVLERTKTFWDKPRGQSTETGKRGGQVLGNT